MNTVRDLLLFDVGAERFALALRDVAAVLDAVSVQLGGTLHATAIGVLRTDDDFVPVFEPSRVLGVECATADPLMLVLDVPAGTIGVLVDHAEAALAVPLEGISDLSGLGSTDGVVLGALRQPTQWVTLLDAGSLVNAVLAHRSALAA